LADNLKSEGGGTQRKDHEKITKMVLNGKNRVDQESKSQPEACEKAHPPNGEECSPKETGDHAGAGYIKFRMEGEDSTSEQRSRRNQTVGSSGSSRAPFRTLMSAAMLGVSCREVQNEQSRAERGGGFVRGRGHPWKKDRSQKTTGKRRGRSQKGSYTRKREKKNIRRSSVMWKKIRKSKKKSHHGERKELTAIRPRSEEGVERRGDRRTHHDSDGKKRRNVRKKVVF